MNRIWTDARSGISGCSAGNYLLDSIAEDDEEFKQEKGTVFSSKKRVIVGRICHTPYLSRSVLHFCNISKAQHDQVEDVAGNRPVFYLFITIRENSLNYWLVPHSAVGEMLQKSHPKNCDSSSFLRIKKLGQSHFINGIDVTKYFSQVAAVPNIEPQHQDLAISMIIDGHRFRGSVQEV